MNKNEAQEQAIHTIDGQMIIIACPGSGKTTTLIRRINYMVTQGNVNPSNILMITFTNAAAKEMGKRYIQNYDSNPGITFCTIHSLCLAILRKFSSFSAADIIQEYDVRRFFYDKLSKNKEIRDKEEFIKSLITDISVVKNNMLDLKSYQPKCCDDKALFSGLYTDYENFKESEHKIDFDDMLIQAFEVMKNSKPCIDWLRNKYRYIQVDEYQDTNFLQRDIIYLLAGENPNLVVVGDDDQSIYGFRGAKPEVMLNFSKDFPDAKVINMSINYRSMGKIIDKAGELIKRNTKRFMKDFICFKESEGQVEKIIEEDRAHEVDNIMKRIKNMLENGVDCDDIAILYRTNKQSIAFADYCMEEKIPFVCTEGIQNKYKHWMFRDIMTFYRVAAGKGKKYEVEQIINKPQRYINHPDYFSRGLDMKHMMDVAKYVNAEKWKREATEEGIINFFSSLKKMQTAKPLEALSHLYTIGQYKKYLKNYAEYRNIEPEELYEIWDSYIEDVKKCGNEWSSWNLFIKSYTEQLTKAKENARGITLSTMHRSKGLEWENVFLVDCVDGCTPFAKAETDDDFEEERRLFYVAMTRAKENLYLYAYRKNHSKRVNLSPYLDEMNQFADENNTVNRVRKKSYEQQKKKPGPVKYIKGDRIIHKLFGKGTVVEVKENCYRVLFDGDSDEMDFDRAWVETKNMFVRIKE